MERGANRKIKGMKTGSFKDLIVWQKSYKLVLEIYKATKAYPKHEIYALAQQMQRSVVSIPSNIAEGYGRRNKKEYRHFLSISYGSLCELETQYMLSADLGYLKQNDVVEGLMKEIGAMLFTMIHKQ